MTWSIILFQGLQFIAETSRKCEEWSSYLPWWKSQNCEDESTQVISGRVFFDPRHCRIRHIDFNYLLDVFDFLCRHPFFWFHDVHGSLDWLIDSCNEKCRLALGCSSVFTNCFQDSLVSMICSDFFFFFCNYMSMLLFEINLQAFWEGFFMQTGSRSAKKDIFMHASMF